MSAVTQSDLSRHDQDHYGGLPSNDALADLATIDNTSHVLDICCGMGGPARYMADKFGCRVTGVDLTESRIEGARRLTSLVGLDGRVDFVNANALDLPFGAAEFDVIISQEGFCHIPNKDRLIAECARVLKPGGRMAFTDVLTDGTLGEETAKRLQTEMAFQELGSEESYRRAFERELCEVISVENMGPAWRDILAERLEMYRGLKDQTVERFGDAHFTRWDAAYSHFVGLYKTGELSGGRFLAVRK